MYINEVILLLLISIFCLLILWKIFKFSLWGIGWFILIVAGLFFLLHLLWLAVPVILILLALKFLTQSYF